MTVKALRFMIKMVRHMYLVVTICWHQYVTSLTSTAKIKKKKVNFWEVPTVKYLFFIIILLSGFSNSATVLIEWDRPTYRVDEDGNNVGSFTLAETGGYLIFITKDGVEVEYEQDQGDVQRFSIDLSQGQYSVVLQVYDQQGVRSLRSAPVSFFVGNRPGEVTNIRIQIN